MPLNSDSAALMCLSLSSWGFSYPGRHLQLCHKYKGQGVPCPPDFRAMPRCRDPIIGVSLGARGYRTSLRVKQRGSQKQGSPPVADDAARPFELQQDHQNVLKKLREMKLGAHIDHVYFCRSTWGRVLPHDCDRRDRPLVA
jgi:hypothetical protein